MRIRTFAFLSILALATMACQGPTAPSAVQAGASLVIPVEGELGVVSPTPLIGYGGTEYEDRQRGTLVFQLTDPSTGAVQHYADPPYEQIELVTRVTTAVHPHLASDMGTSHGNTPEGIQIASLVDVPERVPPGRYGVRILRRLTGQSDVLLSEYQAGGTRQTITVLPHEVQAGPVLSTGTSTPFMAFEFCPSCLLFPTDPYIPTMIPHPQAQIGVGSNVYAVELEVGFPQAAIDVLDVAESGPTVANHRPTVWYDDLGNGRLRISAAGGTQPIESLAIVFDLKTGASPIATADFDVDVIKATNSSGATVSPPITLTLR